MSRHAIFARRFEQKKAGTPSVSAWKGYAFEMICLKHIDEILAAMGLEGIHCEMGTWRYCPKETLINSKFQIQMNFCHETRLWNNEVTIDSQRVMKSRVSAERR